MRPKRTKLEVTFAKKFMDFFVANIDEKAWVDPSVTDKPDLAMHTRGKKIGVEFSQFPSEYIIQNFHKEMPNPSLPENSIVGDLFVYPFEPHRWVHEVLEKKIKSVEINRRRINADEMWLVLHCHSETKEWPMSERSKAGNREAEALLMRFGTSQLGSFFERIYYVYADGTVVALRGGAEVIPSAIWLEPEVGYPAVTEHRLSFSIEVPLPGSGYREHYFHEIEFNEAIVDPVDDWMVARYPEIIGPKFSVTVRIDATEMTWTAVRDGALPVTGKFDTSEFIGKALHHFFVLEWSILPTRFNFRA